MDAPAGVTQEESHTGFLCLPSAGLALIFSREGFSRSFPSSTVRSNFMYPRVNRSPLVGHFFLFFLRKNPSATAPRFELTSQLQKASRLPTEPPGQPAVYSNGGFSPILRGTVDPRLLLLRIALENLIESHIKFLFYLIQYYPLVCMQYVDPSPGTLRQTPHRTPPSLASYNRGTAQETRPSDDFVQPCS